MAAEEKPWLEEPGNVHRGTGQHLLAEDRGDWLPSRMLASLVQELSEELVRRGLVEASPTGNTAERFANDVFAVRAFCWCDTGEWVDEHGVPDDDGSTFQWCPPNFEHFGSELRGEWYKYLGRGTAFNRVPTPGEIARIREECLASIS